MLNAKLNQLNYILIYTSWRYWIR